MSERGNTKVAQCPQCDETIVFSAKKMKLGEHLECPECGEMLEVISLSPLELDYALGDEDGEDWEDWEEEV
jgi:lysine biosynthesis protein LysW